MVDEQKSAWWEVPWKEVFPWLNLLRCFRLAIGVRALVLSAVAVTLTVSGWALLGWVFRGDERLDPVIHPKDRCPWMSVAEVVPDAPAAPSLGTLRQALRVEPEQWRASSPLGNVWWQIGRPFGKIFRSATGITGLAYLLLCGLWTLAVWAFFGGAITRVAAVRLACDERVSLGASLRHARSKWGAYFAAPLFPLIGVFLAAIFPCLLGLLLHVGAGILLASLVWPLALLCGLVMAVLLLGLVFGWPLMWATISVEGIDSFDALSRSYAYVFQRPLRYLFYAAVAAVFGALGWILVSNFAAAVIALTYWGAGWGLGGNVQQMVAEGGEGLGAVGIGIIQFWVGCVKLLAVGFLYSYFWTASTAIYFLLRRDVDATEMDEVFLEEDEDQQTYGLPPLKTDSAGAPVVADQSSEQADQE
jgi:hypothetical protein